MIFNERTRIVKVFWAFYIKILVPSIILSFFLGLIGMLGGSNFLTSVGIAYIIIAPVFHYLVYEKRNKNEYYFYFNQGLSRGFLWILAFIITLLIGFLFIIL